MLVETRREDFAPAQSEAADQGGAALRDLIAAALVTHEAIGDPDRLAGGGSGGGSGGEAAALRALCRHIAGPVYRLAPFHYAFAVGAEASVSLAARLAAELGPEALWVAALDHLGRPPEAPSSSAAPVAEAAPGPVSEPVSAIVPAPGSEPGFAPGTAAETDPGAAVATLLLLPADETAPAAELSAELSTGLSTGPDLPAETDARPAAAPAAAGAPLTEAPTGAPTEALIAALGVAMAARLDAIEARLAALAGEAAQSHAAAARAAEEATETEDAAKAGAEALRQRIGAAIAETIADTGAKAVAEAVAKAADAILEPRLAALAAFEDRVGLALAEFLARLERQESRAPGPVAGAEPAEEAGR